MVQVRIEITSRDLELARELEMMIARRVAIAIELKWLK